MLRLGPALLTALLSGVPRALAPRPRGEPSLFVEVVRSDPDLEAFGEALAVAVARSRAHLARQPMGATAVIRVHGIARCPASGREIVSLSLGDGETQPVMLHYPAEQRVAAAAALLRTSTEPAAAAAT